MKKTDAKMMILDIVNFKEKFKKPKKTAAVEVDYTCGPINGDPKSCPKRVHLVDIIRADWGIRAVELVGLA